jgi:hypothetical protein
MLGTWDFYNNTLACFETRRLLFLAILLVPSSFLFFFLSMVRKLKHHEQKLLKKVGAMRRPRLPCTTDHQLTRSRGLL